VNKKESCIFVIGPESSGSTLIAKIISTALNGNSEWNGRGFNCCNSATCDLDNDFVYPCSEVEHLVCHRSLPFMLEPKWPPIKKWQKTYDARFIICTRDTTISQLSVASRFKRKAETIVDHQKTAKQIVAELLDSEEKCFIWSYETFMCLHENYLQELFKFLKIESNYFPETLKDANVKYIMKKGVGKISKIFKNTSSTKR
jgi:hypothetical protein